MKKRKRNWESGRESFQASKTLCWKCRNAVPTLTDGCSWSLDGIPVDGWDAVKTRVIKDGYFVRACPQYVPDGRKEFSDEVAPWDRLATEVVTNTARDYLDAMNKLMKNHDKYAEALRITDGYEEFSRYANSLQNKYKLRQRSLFAENWWDDISELVSAARRRHTARLRPYNSLVNEYTQCIRTMWECEKFMKSDGWMLYTDADGQRTINVLRERAKFDSEYAIIRKL